MGYLNALSFGKSNFKLPWSTFMKVVLQLHQTDQGFIQNTCVW